MEEVDDAISASGGASTLIPADLNKPEQIAQLGPALTERFGRLDILVANAAILGTLSPVALSDAKIWEGVFRTNVFANYHLIRALDPLLRGSDAGRAIFVTSGVAQRPRAFWSAYAASKAALEAMARAYADEVAYSPLKVNILDPGAVATSMRADAFPAEDPATLPAPESLVPAFLDLAAPHDMATGRVVKAA